MIWMFFSGSLLRMKGSLKTFFKKPCHAQPYRPPTQTLAASACQPPSEKCAAAGTGVGYQRALGVSRHRHTARAGRGDWRGGGRGLCVTAGLQSAAADVQRKRTGGIDVGYALGGGAC